MGVSVPRGGSASANFGYQQVGTIGGVVFNDTNGNGVKDASESGIGGVVVSSDGLTTTTTSDGSYLFTDVEAGNYTISAADLSGFVRTTMGTVDVSVAAGGSASANFGYQQVGTIGGVVFNDANSNGTKDTSESGIGGVVVGYEGITTTSSSDGSYLFTGVEAGNYSVLAADLEDYVHTTPGSVGVWVAAGGSASANFGYRRVDTVGGAAFNDADGDGVYDSSETGVSGVVITLTTSTGIFTRTTVGNGSYLFSDVRTGDHFLSAADVPGFVRTTSREVMVSVSSEGSASAYFGYQQEGTISGIVFTDLNDDGIKGASESGIGGVTVTLQADGGAIVEAVRTVGDGSYLFSDVTQGSYTVEETDPEGFTSTTPNSVAVTLLSSKPSASVNFGDVPIGIVSGVVFHDLDADGLQDEAEPGIGGVTVTLGTGESGQTVGNGGYQFDPDEGTYIVEETNPEGFYSTTPDQMTVNVSTGGSASANFGDRFGAEIFLPLVVKNYDPDAIQYDYSLLLPLVMRNYVTAPSFPVHISSEIPARTIPQSQWYETFYTTTVQIPEEVPDSGAFYFSSRSNELKPVVVDDQLAVRLGDSDVFTYTFSSADNPPVSARVRVPSEKVEAWAGETITVEYRDVYGYIVEASEMWLIWR
jgi:hypothetical protein